MSTENLRPGSPRWTAGRTHSLLWHSWDEDELLVYHSGSGDTHLLNAVAAEVLRQLERSPLEASELTPHVARALGHPPNSELRSYIDQLLDYLDSLGLVEPAP